MSRQRNEILPGAGVWDSFYDKRVQAILEAHRTVPALDLNINLSKTARLEFLAWPIIAYNVVDELVQELSTKVSRHTNFLAAYAQNRHLIARLLHVLTEYHSTNEVNKPLSRRVAEASNQCSAKAMSKLFGIRTEPAAAKSRKLDLHDWKTIQDILGCKNSASQLKTEFHREKERRKRIRARWATNFDAWNDLEKIRADAKESLLPLQNVSVDGF